MKRFRIPVIGKALKRRRVNELVERLGDLEAEMRDVCAALVELTDNLDDLHVEVLHLLKALDG
jgi:hypothetical protein